MNDYISREAVLQKFLERGSGYINELTMLYMINEIPAADVQPLSVVAEHIKKRLYETAFNTSESVARNAIADMAERVDWWINELKDGDAQ